MNVYVSRYVAIAQMVERRPEESEVTGSSPVRYTRLILDSSEIEHWEARGHGFKSRSDIKQGTNSKQYNQPEN